MPKVPQTGKTLKFFWEYIVSKIFYHAIKHKIGIFTFHIYRAHFLEIEQIHPEKDPFNEENHEKMTIMMTKCR